MKKQDNSNYRYIYSRGGGDNRVCHRMYPKPKSGES